MPNEKGVQTMIRNLALALGVGMFLLAGTVSYAATDPVASCKEKKLKETGKKAFGLLKALGKNIKKNPDTNLAKNISKAQSKFTKGFSKAEAKGGCLTTDDSGAIETKVDLFVLDVICELSPPCSPSGAFLDASCGTLD